MEVHVESKYINKRVDSVVTDILSNIEDISLTRNIVQKYIDKGCKVNSKVCKRSYKFKEGDTLLIELEYWKKVNKELDLSKEILPEKGKLDIRYEDNELLVLYKPKGLVVHPGVGNLQGTLANYIRYYLEDKDEYDGLVDRCGIVHRLDKGVSGLMVVAKNKGVQEYLKSQFKEKKVIKIYRAELEQSNKLEKDILINKYLKEMDIKFEPWKKWKKVEGYIGRSSKDRYKMEFKQYEFIGSKYALSYILFFDSHALIKIETGRMHQIRATLNFLGYYIKGDCLYGKSKGNDESIQLESVLLSFVKQSGEQLIFTA